MIFGLLPVAFEIGAGSDFCPRGMIGGLITAT
jgi:Cu/Ag efflux pump CusA